ncbi:MAG TPA: hypothetical protein VEY71_05740 [Chitinophagales bacterium]|nr:hypothetical protein [Chitinophagales bacterium]
MPKVAIDSVDEIGVAATCHFKEESEWRITEPEESQRRNYGLTKATMDALYSSEAFA